MSSTGNDFIDLLLTNAPGYPKPVIMNTLNLTSDKQFKTARRQASRDGIPLGIVIGRPVWPDYNYCVQWWGDMRQGVAQSYLESALVETKDSATRLVTISSRFLVVAGNHGRSAMGTKYNRLHNILVGAQSSVDQVYSSL